MNRPNRHALEDEDTRRTCACMLTHTQNSVGAPNKNLLFEKTFPNYNVLGVDDNSTLDLTVCISFIGQIIYLHTNGLEAALFIFHSNDFPTS